MKPTRGRIVQYHPRARESPVTGPQVALIVDVSEEKGLGPGACEENSVGVFLAVFSRSALSFSGHIVRFHERGAPGTWSWFPRDAATEPPSPQERMLRGLDPG